MSDSHALREAALSLLNLSNPNGVTRKAGSFLGQIVAEPSPLSDAQANWLDALLRKNGLPPVEGV